MRCMHKWERRGLPKTKGAVARQIEMDGAQMKPRHVRRLVVPCICG
jgi:hypothetical protein